MVRLRRAIKGRITKKNDPHRPNPGSARNAEVMARISSRFKTTHPKRQKIPAKKK